VQPDGSTTPVPAQRYFDLVGSATEVLPGNLRARANVNYPSNIATSQTFNTNIYDASRNQRTIGANLVGVWSGYTMNATFNHSEYFFDANNSVLSGGWPQIAFSRNERPLGSSDLYFSVGTEFARFLSDSRSSTTDLITNTTVLTEMNNDVSRFDFSPQLRYPFRRWGWLTANSTIGWRDTFYSRILTPVDPTGAVQQTLANESYDRRFFTFQTQIVGPVFNRIWDTPNNGYAEKFKHSIEPFLTIQKTSNIENFDRIQQFDAVDAYVGDTQFTYGVTNRFYAKRKLVPGQPSQAREIVDVEVRQSHYSDQRAAAFDRQYQTNLVGGGTPSNFSPIAVSVRALPTNDINATVSMEFDSRYRTLRTISTNSSYSWMQRVQTTVGWSRGYSPGVTGGFNTKTETDHYINTSTTVRTRENRYGATYSTNYDVLRSTMTQQQVTGYYNAQCCGLAFQYQVWNYGSGSFSPIPADHRFFLSFTLAGLGNFSPFNGALSGVPR
jgi:hypothetical protein